MPLFISAYIFSYIYPELNNRLTVEHLSHVNKVTAAINIALAFLFLSREQLKEKNITRRILNLRTKEYSLYELKFIDGIFLQVGRHAHT